MNSIRHGLLRCFQSQFRPIIWRGLRRNPNRARDLEKTENFPPNEVVIPALQSPLTEEDLRVLALTQTVVEDDTTLKPTKKKRVPLREKVQPEVNPPMTEPVTAENQYERLAKVVTPLYQVPYKKQLQMKRTKSHEVLQALARKLSDVKAPIERRNKGHLCPLEPVRPSPQVEGYRNKDEFGIHYGIDGNPKTVGFFVGKPSDSLMTCVPSTYLINMKESHKHIAQRFQTFIRQSSHDACHRFDTGGIWRNLMVRSTRSDERMAIVYIHPQDLTKDEISEIMSDLDHFFFNGEGADCELDSLYLQACRHTRCPREQAPYRLIRGKTHITEICEGLSFCISPDSFFQINTGGAEELYSVIREMAEVSPITTLLDVCCGTGTISLVMSPYVRGTVGIEVTTSAVEDAKLNTVANNISNSMFLAGKAEKILPGLTQELNLCTDVVAILNPTRSGLRSDVIQSIRQCEAISKLIYISCKPDGVAMDNFVELAAMKSRNASKIKSPPFVPKYAVPVDMFPHTHHTELVILFERVLV